MQPSKQVLRQVDIVVATPDQYAAAVLAWTGSRQFERDLRDYAKKVLHITYTYYYYYSGPVDQLVAYKAYSSVRSYPLLFTKQEKRLAVKGHAIFNENSGEPLTIKSEEDAFKLLGIPYIEPSMRNC